MRDALRFLLTITYVLVGYGLSLRAARYLKDPDARVFGHQFWHPDFYTDAGQGPRLAAVRFFFVGTPLVVLAFWLLSR